MDRIRVNGVSKSFTLHNQGAANLQVLEAITFTASAGECLILQGESGAGKSTLLRLLYGNYNCTRGEILIRHHEQWIDIATTQPRAILEIRRFTLSYVSQFLRVIPRVSTIDIVSGPLLGRGVSSEIAVRKAGDMLSRLNIPPRLWGLAPATFSGGEQQRVNIARSFIAQTPIMLLDEPTASLDAANRDVVIELIKEARDSGVCLVGIFHDESVRQLVATARFDILTAKQPEAA
jgi:alpha-D-ribose 1-methylphosphonate 5-triphosphate synthase subunit PhnL